MEVKSGHDIPTDDQNGEARAYPDTLQSFGIAGIIVLYSLVATPVFFLVKFIGKEAAMLIYYIIFMGISLYTIYNIRKRKTQNTNFNFRIGNYKIIPHIIIVPLLIFLGVLLPLDNLIPMPEYFQELLRKISADTGICSFLLMVVAAPVMEESIFRGIMLDGLLKRYPPLKSILISSFLFGIVHLNPWQFVTAMGVGIFSGWIYYETKSLTPSILIHATANLCGFIMRTFLNKTDVNSTFMEKQYETYYILFICFSIVLAILCIYYLEKEFRSTDSQSDKLPPDNE